MALLVFTSVVAPAVAVGEEGPDTEVSTPECDFPLSVTDATETEVTIDEEPETVVTLNPSAAQTMWEIGAEEKVIGVTKHAMNLEGAEERTNVSTAGETIEPEIVVELEPDLVLAPLSAVATPEIVETLREAGVTVYAYPLADSIAEVKERTLLTGQMVGECEGATETVEWMNEEIETVETAVEDEPKPDVLYVFFGFTTGEGTHIHEILETAGGNNVAADAGIEEYQQISDETVLEQNPDWIVLNTNSPELPDSEAYERTTAVEENRTIVVDINTLNRPAPRIVNVIAELAEAFHPEAYAEAVEATLEPTPDAEQDETPESTPDAEQDETPEPTPDAEPTPEPTPDDADDQPGFGVAVALVALSLSAVLAAKRRSDRTKRDPGRS